MNNTKSSYNRLLLTGGAVAAVVTLAVLWMFPILTHHFELQITDLKFNIRSRLDRDPGMDQSIVLVNLDDYSKRQSHFDLWPYSYYTAAIEKINAGDPTSWVLIYSLPSHWIQPGGMIY